MWITTASHVTSNSSAGTPWGAAVGPGQQGALCLIGAVMAGVGGMGNALVVALVARCPPMQSPINLLLTTMALCDCLSCLLLLPLDLLSLLGSGWLLPEPLCPAHALLTTVVQTETALVLAVIALDRYHIIIHHRERLTRCLTAGVMATTWAISVSLAVPALAGVGVYASLPLPPGLTHCQWKPSGAETVNAELAYAICRFAVTFLLPLLIMVACFACIMAKGKNTSLKIHCKQNVQDEGRLQVIQKGVGEDRGVSKGDGEGTNTEADTVNTVPPRSTPSPIQRQATLDLRYKTRTVSTILVLFFLFLLFRAPLHLAHLFLVLAWRGTGTWGYRFHSWLVWWAYVQPTLNPVVYTLRIPRLRAGLQETFPWLDCLLACHSPAVTDHRHHLIPGTLSIIQLPRRPLAHSSPSTTSS